MASTLKHLRSSTADKRPTASGLVDGQLAINTASGTPALFFKDNNGGVVKVGPAHVGSTAPNAVPAGSAGNSLGELWVDNGLTTPGLNYYTGSAFVNLTPSGTTTTVGLVELATPAETQAGTDAIRAVTPSGLQSKVSDSTSTTSSTTIASSTAVKSAYDLANAALPKAGGTVTGELLIGNTGSLVFEGSSDDSFETTIAVVDPTGDRTITFPNVTGTVVTTGDSGTVTSTMIANDTIVNADINSAAAIAYSKLALSSGIVNTDISASAAIVDTKLATISTADKVSISALDIDGATDIGGALEGGDLFVVDDGAGGTNRKAPAFRMSQLVYSGVTGDIAIASGGTASISAGVIVNADINSSAAIDFSKLASLTSANILLGNASNVATSTAVTGDVTISNTGVTAIASGAIVDADISASAEIAVSKLADGAARQLLQTDAAGTGVEWASNIDIPGTLDVTSAATFDSTIGASAGTASLPSITFTGDLNTGIYSPGADQVAISTGGSQRLLIDSYGIVTPGGGVFSGGVSSYAVNGLVLNFSSPFSEIRACRAGGNYGGLKFYTQGANSSGAQAERMTISTEGLVGIGTSAPSENLTVYGTSSRLAVTGGAGSSAILLGNQNGSGANNPSVIEAANGALYFGGGNSWSGGGTFDYTMTLTNDNKVGIGTTSPGAKFQVTDALGDIQIDGGSINANRADGFYLQASSYLRIYTNGAERARIDSSGRLLVGTSSAQGNATLQIQGDAANATNWGRFFLRRGQSIATIGSNVGTRLGQIDFGNQDGAVGATIQADTDATWGSGDYPTALVFSTTRDGAASPTEAVRINEKGALKVTTTGSYNSATNKTHELRNDLNDWGVYIHNVNATPRGLLLSFPGASPNGTGNEFLYCDDSSALRASIRSNGGLVNFQANNVNLSDRNAKKDITPAADTWNCVKEWEIVNYRYKDQLDDTDLNLGVIAQQVAESCPEVITVFQEATEDEPEKLGVKEQQMYWMAIKALQEAQVRIEQLEAKVAALEAA